MIREGRWPSGYPPILLVQGVFEGGTRQDDLVRMSGLAVVSFTGMDHNDLSELRQAARDDPHTMLLFGSVDDGLTVIYAYELDKSYDVESQRKFYQKVLVYGNDYYEAQLETVPLRKGKKPKSVQPSVSASSISPPCDLGANLFDFSPGISIPLVVITSNSSNCIVPKNGFVYFFFIVLLSV